jgi:hypothetical protein
MRTRYTFAVAVAAVSLATVIGTYFDQLIIPDLPSLKLYVYGLGAFGLAAAVGLAYEARTGKRIDAKPFGGCFLIVFGIGSGVVYKQAYDRGVSTGVDSLTDLWIEWAWSAASVAAGIALIVWSLRARNKKH